MANWFCSVDRTEEDFQARGKTRLKCHIGEVGPGTRDPSVGPIQWDPFFETHSMQPIRQDTLRSLSTSSYLNQMSRS